MKILNQVVLVASFLIGSLVYADTPATHGMLLFGNHVTYISHLPMFYAPHDYQMLAKISIAATPHSLALSKYENLKSSGETFFTLVPEKVDLTLVISGAKTTLSASIYRGDFENGGQDLGLVDIHVDKMVYAKKLDPSEVTASSENYLAFGEKGEYFALHLINSKPSFDQVIQISQPYQLESHFCRTRACGDDTKTPIADNQLPMSLAVFNGTSLQLAKVGDELGDLGSAVADVLNSLYVDQADLAQ